MTSDRPNLAAKLTEGFNILDSYEIITLHCNIYDVHANDSLRELAVSKLIFKRSVREGLFKAGMQSDTNALLWKVWTCIANKRILHHVSLQTNS